MNELSTIPISSVLYEEGKKDGLTLRRKQAA